MRNKTAFRKRETWIRKKKKKSKLLKEKSRFWPLFGYIMVPVDNVEVHVSKVDIYIGNGQVKRMLGCQLRDYGLAEIKPL